MVLIFSEGFGGDDAFFVGQIKLCVATRGFAIRDVVTFEEIDFIDIRYGDETTVDLGQ